MTHIKEVINWLEQTAPRSYQESYDNCGLLTGDADEEVRGVLCCLDVTEAVVAEAVHLGCNLVLAHHPILFKGLKSLTGRTYVERTILRAVRSGVAIYAMHTNLDNVYHRGVNGRIAERLQLTNTKVLAPKAVGKKLTALLPRARLPEGQSTLEAAGCSRFHIAEGEQHSRVEAYFPSGKFQFVVEALQALSPEGAYEITAVENADASVGSGMIGELAKAMDERDFLDFLRKELQAPVVRHTQLLGKPVKKVAVCGGAGSFLLPAAKAAGAEVFVSADFKYHEFFDAENQLVIMDIGHFESEQFTIELLRDLVAEKFSTFAPLMTGVNTNPIHYYHD